MASISALLKSRYFCFWDMLRRYFARTRWNAGWPLELISQALGHRHLDTTTKYLGILDDKLLEASHDFYAKHSNLYGIDKIP